LFLVQGVELVGSKAIIYGAGGFLDDYALDEDYKNNLGCIWIASYCHGALDQGLQAGTTLSGDPKGPLASSEGASVEVGGMVTAAGQQWQQQQMEQQEKGKRLQLCKLEAIPTKINHIWRSERAEGPAYMSQVSCDATCMCARRSDMC
jgi:hypothetical protein